jgi:hypothetical protein
MIPVVVILALLANTAEAEGARLVLDCGPEALRFEFTPQQVDAEGAGLYALAPAGAAARALSRTGPFVWNTPEGLQATLLVLSATEALYVLADRTGAIPAVVTPLTCVVTL